MSRHSRGSRLSEPPAKRPKIVETSKSSSLPGLNGKIALKEARRFSVKGKKTVWDFDFMVSRAKVLSGVENVSESARGIVYWMSRDQRIQDNWAMVYAQKLALINAKPLHVCVCLYPDNSTSRQFQFMLGGLKEVKSECLKLNIGFHLLLGPPNESLVEFVQENEIGAIVADFSPLRNHRKLVRDLVRSTLKNVCIFQVDAHNIVPVWVASDKQEFAARTFRPKIHRVLNKFLTEFPVIRIHPFSAYSVKVKPKELDWTILEDALEVDTSVSQVEWATPGAAAGLLELDSFCRQRLKFFADYRNDPNVDALSHLSPWLHFGQVSAQRVILEVKKRGRRYPESVDVFIEEAVVRKELSDNFCFYNPHYDQVRGAADWAKETLNVHRYDERGYLYSRKQLDEAKTHDDLWNAAQIQMKTEGKMHGFLRMYWAKKILEWTESPEKALSTVIYLNDRYELDGRDPNGYVGCMWSICGTHDRAWPEREVFGKIRYMNYRGALRKFDVESFVAKYGAFSYSYEDADDPPSNTSE